MPHAQLTKLQAQGYLPPSDLVLIRAGLTTFSGEALAEKFPIHPSLGGLLEYYGLQLHNLTPGSILHIAGFVALCELFLGCEAHFDLWRKYFCLVPRS